MPKSQYEAKYFNPREFDDYYNVKPKNNNIVLDEAKIDLKYLLTLNLRRNEYSTNSQETVFIRSV